MLRRGLKTATKRTLTVRARNPATPRMNLAKGPRGLKYNVSGAVNAVGGAVNAVGGAVGATMANCHRVGMDTFASQKRTIVTEATMAVGAAGTALTAFAAYRFKVADANQYLVRTGLGISDMVVSKTGFQWPFQKYMFVNMQPRTYEFKLPAKSSEKLDYMLPGVFVIGPKNDTTELVKFARYLHSQESSIESDDDGELIVQTTNTHVDSLVMGVIEGATRVTAASITLEEAFNDRDAFKHKVIAKIQEELDPFGMCIYTANIKELEDAPGSEYFQFKRMLVRSEVEGQSKIDIAEADRKAEIGQKEREADARKRIAEYEADAVERENETRQQVAKSNAALGEIQAEADRKVEVAKIEAKASADQRAAELQQLVEQRRIAEQTEMLRAEKYAGVQVEAEMAKKDAEGKADAMRLLAEAELYREQQRAEGIRAVYEAQAQGVGELVNRFGNDQNALLQYLMVDRGTFVDLAKTSANAVQGLNPKITVWKTGSEASDPIKNILQNLPPALSTIYDQTGIKPGKWLVDMPDAEVQNKIN